MNHEHDWKPIPGYSGRYRCEVCKGMGYRGVVVRINKDSPRTAAIIPYACSHPECGGVATSKGGLCAPHKNQAKQEATSQPKLPSVRVSATTLAMLRELAARGPIPESEIHPATRQKLVEHRLALRARGQFELNGTGRRVLAEYTEAQRR